LICAGVSVAVFLFWSPVLAAQLGVIDQLAFWAPAFSVANLSKVFLAYTGLVFNMASSVFYLPLTVGGDIFLGLVFVAALLMGLRRGPRSALIWLVVGLGIPWLLSGWKAGIFVWYRYPILMFPAFVMLLASGFLSLKPAAIRVALILIALSSQVWGDWLYFHGWQKGNAKSVVQFIHKIRQPNAIVVRPTYFAELFNFYDQGTTLTLDEHVLDSPEKRAALTGRDIILLAFDVPSDPVAAAILGQFKPVSARYFPGTAHLGITVYELK
jgi:hypothetical protein